MGRRLPGFFLLVSLPAISCGEVAAPSPGEDDGRDDGSGTAEDGGPEPDADGADDGDGRPATKGLIYAFSRSFTNAGGGPIEEGTLEAAFGDYETESCDIELSSGACSVVTCTSRDPAASRPDAGTIDVFVNDARLTQMTPLDDGLYASLNQFDVELFPAGAQLAASAGGDDVPAFDIDIIAPTPIFFDEGVPTSARPIDVTILADHALRWAPSSAARDRVRLGMTTTPDEDGVRGALDCRVLANVGDLVIPSAVLSRLKDGFPDSGPLDFEARVESELTVGAGDYDVTLAGAVVARDGATGDWARGQVNLVP